MFRACSVGASLSDRSVDHIGYSRGVRPKRSDHGFQSRGFPSTSEGESDEEQVRRTRGLTWVHSEELFFD